MLDRVPLRRAVIDAALVVGVTIAAHMVIAVGFSVMSGLSLTGLGGVVVGSIRGSWPVLLAFTILTALIAWSGWSRRARLRLAVPTAVAAWFAGQAVLGAIAGMPLPDYLLWTLVGLLPFALAALVAGMITSATGEGSAVASPASAEDLAEPSRPDSSGALPIGPVVRAVALGAAVLLTLSLPWQWFRVYFQLFGGSERTATPEQGALYLATFVAAAGLTVLAAILAMRQRRQGSTAAAVVTFFVVILVGFVCQVPAGTVWITPAPAAEYEVDPHWQECAWDASQPGCGG